MKILSRLTAVALAFVLAVAPVLAQPAISYQQLPANWAWIQDSTMGGGGSCELYNSQYGYDWTKGPNCSTADKNCAQRCTQAYESCKSGCAVWGPPSPDCINNCGQSHTACMDQCGFTN